MTSLLRQVGLLLLLLAFAALMSVRPVTVALAQQSSQPEAAAEQTAAADEDGSEASADEEALPEDAYTDEELDDLVAPVALYPDSLLAQVLVAATYPLDIVKAQRWADANQELPDDERTEAAQTEDWDPSVAVLAAGFPTVLQKMADEIDWTEQLGDAMLVQDSDVLDAVQRQRALAAAVGNLESNEAQTVEVQDDQITVAPADPEVVYVPVYDSQTVYTQPATSTTVVQESDDKYSSGELIATGVLAFGAGMIVNEVFRDDDPYYGYWRGPPPVRWGGGGGVYARPGRNVNINGDVNINSNNNNKWQPDNRQKAKAKRDIKKRNDKAGSNRKGSNRKVSDRKARGGGKNNVKHPGQKSQTASLENRMKKRDSGAAKKKPSAKKRDNNAFKGAKGSGTASKKSLNRGKSSSKKNVASKSSNRKAGSQAKRKADAGPKRKTGADKHKRSKNKGSASRNKSRGKAKAQRGGGGRRGRG